MKLRLKESPREWRKFGLSSAAVLALLGGFLLWRGLLTTRAAVWAFGVLLLGALLAILRPAWLRGPYRLGMRVSHALGRVVAPVVLSLIFLLVLTPLGLLVRWLGKDLLRLRRPAPAESCWQKPTGSGDLTKMF